jgi:hypothetical protein
MTRALFYHHAAPTYSRTAFIAGGASILTDSVLAQTARHLAVYAADWQTEVPSRIHSGAVDAGGAPEWHPEFARWLTRTDRPHDPRDDRYRNPENRLRVTRAMRAIRRAAPREYEVVYRVMCLGDTVASTTRWLNERAIRGGHPERYRQKDTIAILVCGVSKIAAWA